MNPAARTPLRRWRILRAAIMAFLVVKIAGWNPLADSRARAALAVAALAVGFVLALKFERWIQDERDEAERPPEP